MYVLSEACVLLGAGSSGSKSNLGGAASQSWGELASRASNALKGNTGSRQHTPSLASSQTSDQSSSSLGRSSTGSSLGHSTGQHPHSGTQGVGGGQALGVGTGVQAQEEDFLSQRDPTNPSSVVGAHSAWIAEPHTALTQGGWVPGAASDRCLRLCHLVHDYKHNQQTLLQMISLQFLLYVQDVSRNACTPLLLLCLIAVG